MLNLLLSMKGGHTCCKNFKISCESKCMRQDYNVMLKNGDICKVVDIEGDCLMLQTYKFAELTYQTVDGTVMPFSSVGMHRLIGLNDSVVPMHRCEVASKALVTDTTIVYIQSSQFLDGN